MLWLKQKHTIYESSEAQCLYASVPACAITSHHDMYLCLCAMDFYLLHDNIRHVQHHYNIG